MSVLDERTKVPLFAVIVALPFVVGGVLWMSSIDSKATAASVEAANTKELILEVRDRLIRIENRLNKEN